MLTDDELKYWQEYGMAETVSMAREVIAARATVIEQQTEIDRLRGKMLQLLTMLDYDKSSDRYRIAVDAAYEEFGQ